MKNILFVCLMTACLFSFGKCTKKKKCCSKKATTETSSAKLNANEVWMQYDETKCANPWHFEWFAKPTEEQITGAVKSELIGREIKIIELISTYKDIISCEACTCSNGRVFYARVNKSEIEKLKNLKFYEVKEVPDSEVKTK